MTMNHRYKPNSKFEAAARKVTARIKSRDAILGNEAGFVDDPERVGYHFARFAASADVNNNATFGPVLGVRANPGAGYSPVAGRRVRIKQSEEDGEWEVEKANFQDLIQAGIDPRGMNPNDPYRAFRYLDELVDLSSRGIGDGLLVQVQGWKYYTADYDFKVDIGTDATIQIDLTSSVPGAAGNYRYAVVVFNITEHIASNTPWQVYDSDTAAVTPNPSSALIQSAFDLFPKDEHIVPIMAYYLENGQEEIKGPAYNVDLRTAWNIYGVIDKAVTLAKLADGTPGKVIGFNGSGVPSELDPGGQYYQTVQEDGVDVAQQPKLNFVSSGSVDITVTDNPTDNSTDILIEAIAGAGTDTTAIHDNVAGEISAITTKTTPVSGDYLLIEDSADSDAKKKITIGSLPRTGYIAIRDQKTQNTQGGSFNSGADRTRDLNTIDTDTTGTVSLSTNQFTLVAGTYRITASAPAHSVGVHQAWLYNVTDGAVVLRGTSEYTSTSVTNRSSIYGRFTISGTKAFEIRHRCFTTRGTDGFGVASNFGAETYTMVVLEKE